MRQRRFHCSAHRQTESPKLDPLGHPGTNRHTRRLQRLLADLKTRVRETRLRAALAVNSELSLYWQIGRDIRERQAGARLGRQGGGSDRG
jgi:hypothetical protein